MPGIGIILNRNAGKRRPFGGQSGVKLGYIVGDPTSCVTTDSVSEIDGVAERFRERDIEILAIGGGDGSNHHVLTAFARIYGDRPLPWVAFLRGGTHNACARSIGVKGTPESILERIVRRYHGSGWIDTTSRSLLRVDDGTSVRYGFTICTGFLYRFFHQMHLDQCDTPAKVALLIASLFTSYISGNGRVNRLFCERAGRITLGGVPLAWHANNGVAASTMEQVGLGFKPFSRANETAHTFHALAFRIQPIRFARISWDLLMGRLENHREHLSTVVDRLVVEAPEPINYALDGDLFKGGCRLEVGLGPRLRLVLV
jgi:hypothetical protein